jgi:hypothetical protein
VNHSEQLNEIALALSKAQGMFINPPKNRDVTVAMKTGGTYKFSYATLDSIMDSIRKPLSDNGLALVHALTSDEQGPVCETRLIHASGQWISCWVPIIVAEGANAQGWGSAITYARRYGLCSLLAIAADEDDDSNAACGNTATAAPRKATPTKPAPKPSDPAVQAQVMIKTIQNCENVKSLVETLDALPGIFGDTIPDAVKDAGRQQCEALAMLAAAKGTELAKLTLWVSKTRYMTEEAKARVLEEIATKKDSVAMAG